MEKLLEWIDIVGLDKSDVISVYRKKVIRGDHFEDSCSSPGTKQFIQRTNILLKKFRRAKSQK